jgi:hypothetical protein
MGVLSKIDEEIGECTRAMFWEEPEWEEDGDYVVTIDRKPRPETLSPEQCSEEIGQFMQSMFREEPVEEMVEPSVGCCVCQ